MRRFAVALILALMVFGTQAVRAQTVPESDLWQDTDRAEALQRMIFAAENVCSPLNQQTRTMDRVSELEREFISTVRPLVRATLAGLYGHDIPFWQEKITKVQALKKSPENVLRAVVEVQTYEGAHNPYGIDTIEFQLVPGPHFFVAGALHRQHPEARPRR